MARTKFNPAVAISDLVRYAQETMDLGKYDAIYAKNQLFALFGVTEPADGHDKLPDFQTGILDPLVNYGIKTGLCKEIEKLLFETKVMGLVTPAPGTVIAQFDAIAATDGIEKATDYLHRIGVSSNYLRMPDISKNIMWTAPAPMGDLTITINLSKPEKSREQVEAERNLPASNYPRCMLCVENLGFNGNLRHPARETIRIIPIFLNDEKWFFQLSPYVYFDNHCIAISEEHHPMAITPATFVRLTDFVEQLPHYFMGSNADLPIVGGSILAHEHYQGGKKVLPMFKRPDRKTFASAKYSNVKVSILDWYNSVIKLTSKDKKSLCALADEILLAWREYSDESVGVLAKTTAPHNTITPIACFDKENGYELYLILRNNRTDEAHPHGIYHPTEDMHNVKKEGIGLIEAMGLFILPGRLAKEIEGIVDILSGKTPLNFAEISKEDHPLFKHLHAIAQLANDNGVNLSMDDAEKAVVSYVNTTCVKILECTGVFKNDEIGQNAFVKFLNSVDIK